MKYLIAVALLAACCVAAAADDCKSCQSGSCSITSATDGGLEDHHFPSLRKRKAGAKEND